MEIQKFGFWVLLVMALVGGGLCIGTAVLADDHAITYQGSISEDQKACFQEEASKSWVKLVELYPQDVEECSSVCSGCGKDCSPEPTDFKVVTVNERYEFPYGESSYSAPALEVLPLIAGILLLGSAGVIGFVAFIELV